MKKTNLLYLMFLFFVIIFKNVFKLYDKAEKLTLFLISENIQITIVTSLV